MLHVIDSWYGWPLERSYHRHPLDMHLLISGVRGFAFKCTHVRQAAAKYGIRQLLPEIRLGGTTLSASFSMHAFSGETGLITALIMRESIQHVIMLIHLGASSENHIS